MTASYEAHTPPPPPVGAAHIYANYHPMDVIMALAGGASPKGDPNWELFKYVDDDPVGWHIQLPGTYSPEGYLDVRVNDLREQEDHGFFIVRQGEEGYVLRFQPKQLGYTPLNTDYIKLWIEEPA